jgi:putative ABC transport system permease protein
MWKATLANLRAHRLRLILTALSIVLGVAFVTGTLVFTDTLHNTFDQLFKGVDGKISVQVREPSPVNDQYGNKAFIPMPASILPQVAHLPGVAASEGSVSGFAQLVDKHNKAITTTGAPTIGASYGTVREISGFSLASGHAPQGPGEVVIDKGTADKHGFKVGDPIEILFQGPPQRFTIVGIVKFGKANGLGGATVAEFDLPVAQQLLNRVGTFDAVNLLASPGVSPATLQATVAPHLPSGYQAVTGSQLAKENADQVNKGLSIITDFLLVFALVSLFVGSFIILNTFSILVAQRTREFALFRALGASRRQVLLATLIEAAAVGLLAAVLGVALGVLLATGLEAVFKAVGASVPSYGLVFKPRTAVVGLVVGVGVSLLASLNPARRASRVPPVAALGSTVAESQQTPVRRTIIGTICLALGVVLMMVGLFVSHHNQAVQVGIGIALTFLGVATLAPFVARPVTGVIGRPLRRLSGVAGVLARENAMRNPRRTAATASALMIGLALVTMFSVLGQSAKASVDNSIKQEFRGDYVVKTTGTMFGNFSPTVEPRVAAVPGVEAISPERNGNARLGSSTVALTAVNADSISKLLKIDVKSGSLSSLARGEIMVEKNTASSKHLKVGSPIQLRFAKTGLQTLVVGGTYASSQLIGTNYLVSTNVFEANFTDQLDQVLMVKVAGNANPVAVRNGIDQAISTYPNVTVENPAQVEKDQASQVNQLLTIIYVMLALAILIAVLGIINTLVLSVVERTREFALLRAVGMARRQVRTMVRGESVVIALFGAVLGVLVGLGFGVALVAAIIRNQGGVVSIPVSSLVVFVVLATIFGIVAAVWPARRAARTNVITALAFE